LLESIITDTNNFFGLITYFRKVKHYGINIHVMITEKNKCDWI